MNKTVPHPFLEWQYLDKDSGMIMPWYTRPCLDWLKTIDVSKWKVFEYGCGMSTLWWRFNASSVYSVDNDLAWRNKIKYLEFKEEKHEYITHPMFVHYHSEPHILFDCIIIDGHHRDECTQFALDYLKPGGYIIIDNYHQPSCDLPASEWTRTDALLKNYPVVIFSEEKHPDWKTALFQIV